VRGQLRSDPSDIDEPENYGGSYNNNLRNKHAGNRNHGGGPVDYNYYLNNLRGEFVDSDTNRDLRQDQRGINDDWMGRDHYGTQKNQQFDPRNRHPSRNYNPKEYGHGERGRSNSRGRPMADNPNDTRYDNYQRDHYDENVSTRQNLPNNYMNADPESIDDY
jgi:hypothetical protein